MPGPNEDSTIIAVGDVAGKGVEAARRATFVRTSLATFVQVRRRPVPAARLSNQVLVERTGTSSVFVTAIVVALHPREGRFEWASAGHPPPVRLDSGEMLDIRPSLPLGIDSVLTCRRSSETLTAGTGILLFTDGLTEAHRPHQPAVRGSPGERGAARAGRLGVRRSRRAPPSRTRSPTRGTHSATTSVSSRPGWWRRRRRTDGPPGSRSRPGVHGTVATLIVRGELDIATTPQLEAGFARPRPGARHRPHGVHASSRPAESRSPGALEQDARHEDAGVDCRSSRPGRRATHVRPARPRRAVHVRRSAASVARSTVASITSAPRACATDTR